MNYATRDEEVGAAHVFSFQSSFLVLFFMLLFTWGGRLYRSVEERPVDISSVTLSLQRELLSPYHHFQPVFRHSVP